MKPLPVLAAPDYQNVPDVSSQQIRSSYRLRLRGNEGTIRSLEQKKPASKGQAQNLGRWRNWYQGLNFMVNNR